MAFDSETYRAFVESEMKMALAGKGPRVFGNRGELYARIVTDVMIENTKSRLAFLCGYMSASVYDPARLIEFLNKPNTSVRVILDGPPRAEAIDSALAHLGDLRSRVQLKKIPYQLGFHFGVADDCHVRREQDIKDRVASVVFGDKAMASAALTTFEKLWHLESAV